MRNNIGIIDADLLDNGTRHPNLALMKISGFYKEKGCKIKLLDTYKDISNYDRVYISKVFTFTNIPVGVLDNKNIIIGGTGFFADGGESLSDEIEHHMPDYHLYDDYIKKQIKNGIQPKKYSDYLNYSIGFTTRGCFRKCEFCVNKKYDKAFKHSPVNEFLDIKRKYIYLWDDNILAYSGWEEIINELEATNKKFQFRQGIDIRLMTERKAERLSKVKYHGDYIFAFDNIEEKEIIQEKLNLWKKYCKKTTKLYVFCAFDRNNIWDLSFWKQDIIDTFERIKILMKYGCLPYIMRYEKYKESKYKSLYTQVARWCNQPQFYKKKSFRQFCEANQFYHKNPKTNCSAYQSMLDFEKEHPDIAKEYFNMRFDEIKEF